MEVPRKKGGASAVTQALALPAFVAGIEKGATWAVAAAEDARSAEGKYWLARMVETPYQNPQEFMYCGEHIDKDYYYLHPRKWRTRAPVFNRGSGGGARGCGFEERVGVHARTGWVQFT